MSRLREIATVAGQWIGCGIGRGWMQTVQPPGIRELGGLVIVVTAAIGWRLLSETEQADARPPAAAAATAGHPVCPCPLKRRSRSSSARSRLAKQAAWSRSCFRT